MEHDRSRLSRSTGSPPAAVQHISLTRDMVSLSLMAANCLTIYEALRRSTVHILRSERQ